MKRLKFWGKLLVAVVVPTVIGLGIATEFVVEFKTILAKPLLDFFATFIPLYFAAIVPLFFGIGSLVDLRKDNLPGHEAVGLGLLSVGLALWQWPYALLGLQVLGTVHVPAIVAALLTFASGIVLGALWLADQFRSWNVALGAIFFILGLAFFNRWMGWFQQPTNKQG